MSGGLRCTVKWQWHHLWFLKWVRIHCSSVTGYCVIREKRKTNRRWWKESSVGKQPKILRLSQQSHVWWRSVAGIKVACDLPAWPLILTVFRFKKPGSCASSVFNLWDSVRVGRGVPWEGWSRPSCVYFGGQKGVSQQGACCHHSDLRTKLLDITETPGRRTTAACGMHSAEVREQGCCWTWAQMSGQSIGAFSLSCLKIWVKWVVGKWFQSQ